MLLLLLLLLAHCRRLFVCACTCHILAALLLLLLLLKALVHSCRIDNRRRPWSGRLCRRWWLLLSTVVRRKDRCSIWHLCAGRLAALAELGLLVYCVCLGSCCWCCCACWCVDLIGGAVCQVQLHWHSRRRSLCCQGGRCLGRGRHCKLGPRGKGCFISSSGGSRSGRHWLCERAGQVLSRHRNRRRGLSCWCWLLWRRAARLPQVWLRRARLGRWLLARMLLAESLGSFSWLSEGCCLSGNLLLLLCAQSGGSGCKLCALGVHRL